jgi:hypothetical protein
MSYTRAVRVSKTVIKGDGNSQTVGSKRRDREDVVCRRPVRPKDMPKKTKKKSHCNVSHTILGIHVHHDLTTSKRTSSKSPIEIILRSTEIILRSISTTSPLVAKILLTGSQYNTGRATRSPLNTFSGLSMFSCPLSMYRTAVCQGADCDCATSLVPS